jgi:hypothetical protein
LRRNSTRGTAHSASKDAAGIEVERGGRDATPAARDPTEDHVLIVLVRKVVVTDLEDLEHQDLDLDKVAAKAVDLGEPVQTQAQVPHVAIAVIAEYRATSVTVVRSRLQSLLWKDGSSNWFLNLRLSRASPSRYDPALRPTPSSNLPA